MEKEFNLKQKAHDMSEVTGYGKHFLDLGSVHGGIVLITGRHTTLAAPVITEALFRSVTCIQRLWEIPKGRYSKLALMSSRQLVENGDIHC